MYFCLYWRRKEAEESSRRVKENAQVGPSNHGGVPNALMSPDSAGKDLSTRTAGPATSSSVNGMDLTGYFGVDLLSEPVSIYTLIYHCLCQVCIFLKWLVVIVILPFAGETFMLRVKDASSDISKDARATVCANDGWQCHFKIGCSSIIPDGNH